MADVTPQRNNIPQAGAQFLSAVSENLVQAVAGETNFINYYQLDEKRFVANGNYSTAVLPFLGFDGMSPFEFKSQIVDAWLVICGAGSSGTTEVDIKLATTPGGTFTSIFTQTPTITWQAGSYTWVGCVTPAIVGTAYSPSPAYAPPANTRAGILNRTITDVIPAWSAIRADLLQAQQGSPFTCELVIRYRPV